MAQFQQEFSLSSCTGLKKFYPLPIAILDKCFVVKDGPSSLLKVCERKIQHTWTLKYPHSFTSSPVLDTLDQKVYCIMDQQILMSWSIDEERIKSASKFKLQENALFVVPVLNHKPLIVFVSGCVLSIEDIECDSTPKGEKFQNADIVWAEAITGSDEDSVTVLLLVKEESVYVMHSFIFESDACHSYKRKEIAKIDDVLNWSLNHFESSLYVLLKSGTITNHEVRSQAPASTLALPSSKDHRIDAISTIDSTHLVLLKSNSKHTESWLEVWDIKFSVLKATKPLKIPTSQVQISVIDNSVFISHSKDLLQIPISVQKSTLAAAIGKAANVKPKLDEFSWSKGKAISFSNPDGDTDKFSTSSQVEDELSVTENIAQRLMQKDLAFLNYIPESELVKLLRLALKYKFKKEKMKNLNIDPDIILNAVLSAPFSDASVLRHLTKLSLEETMNALDTLLAFSNTTDSSHSSTATLPTDLQLFSWICLILQSKMSDLRISKDKKCMKLLKKLDSALSEKMEEYEDYEQIQNSFRLLQKKDSIFPDKHFTGKYCVESLYI